jgi:hypothetical protein
VSKYRIGRDPYSDSSRDCVLWDGMKIVASGSRRECEQVRHYLEAGDAWAEIEARRNAERA